ncbi:MAG: DoxX family protein [Bacteroidetes bacterium]|nr:MAG: DoxX family protein [Bacteroidota bacterium]
MFKSLLSSKPFSTDFILLVLRICVAAFMIYGHGLPKIERFGADEVKFINLLGMGAKASLGLAIFAELGCSILLGLGLFTRLASIPLAFTMFIAAFVANADKPFQGKELALMYLLAFALFFFTGPGKYSVDKLIKKQ